MAIQTDQFRCANCRGEFYLADYNIADELYNLPEEEFSTICDGTHKHFGILCDTCYHALNKVIPFEDDITTSGTVH